MTSKRHLRFGDFSGGLWLPTGPVAAPEFGVPPDALTLADNVDYLPSGGIRGRRGRTELTTSAFTGTVVGLWRHYPRSGTPKTLAAVDTGAVVNIWEATGASGSFTLCTGTNAFTTGTRPRFVNWPAKDSTFIQNGVDAFTEYDGTTLLAVTQNDIAVDGPYHTIHKGRHYSTISTELTHSLYGSDVNDETTHPAANQLSLNDPQGGSLVGVTSFFDFLLILKQTSIFRFIGDISTTLGAQLSLYTDTGCVAPDTIATSRYGVFFLGRSGLYLTDGVSTAPDEVSFPLRELFTDRDGQTVYPDAIGQWYPRREQYVLKLDPTAADAYVLTRVELVVENPFTGERSRTAWLWSHHTSLPATAMATWDSEVDDGRLITGDANGQIWIADEGSTDDGAIIAITVQTGSRPVSSDGMTGRVYHAKVLHRGSVVMNGELLYDQAAPTNGAGFTIGDAISLGQKWSRDTIEDRALQGRFVAVRLNNSTDGPDFELHVIDLEMQARSSRVWRGRNVP